MSDKDDVELIAAAQVNAFTGPPAGIEFKSNFGFRTATRSSDGSYVLELKHDHDPNKLVVNATRINASPGEISASLLSKDTIQVSNFDDTDAPSDSPFWIVVYRVRD